mmetsp:Transcript_32754/g.79623  ORF Transcript_32754/g.79623 Transcript_32754/m.79623 type:complete len:151 (-) Transcript_32754:478-930(-)
MKLKPDDEGVAGAGALAKGANGSCTAAVDGGVGAGAGAGAATAGGAGGAGVEDIPNASKSATNPPADAVFVVVVDGVVAGADEKSNKSVTGAGAGAGGRETGAAATGGRAIERGALNDLDGGGPDNGTAVATAIPPVAAGAAGDAPLSSP